MATKVKTAAVVSELALVPDASYCKGYVGRTFDGGRSDFDVYEFARRNHHNVLIEGPTGSAKTTSVLAYAAKNHLPFYSVSSSAGTEPSQLFGKYIPAEDGSFVWQDGPVTHLFRHGGVLLLNEVNFIPTRIASVLFSALDRRRTIQLVDHKGEVITAHDDLLIVADLNPNYLGTNQLNAAFRNRFTIQLDWDYQPAIEKKLVEAKTLHTIAGKLRTSQRQGEIETPVGTNMLIEFEQLATGLGLEFATTNFVNHFRLDERESVSYVLNTFQANLKTDFAKTAAATPAPGDVLFEDEDEEVFSEEELRAMNLGQIKQLARDNYGIALADLRNKSVDEIVDFLFDSLS